MTTDLWDRLLGTGTDTNIVVVAKNIKRPMYDSEQTLTERFFTTDSWMRGTYRNPALRGPHASTWIAPPPCRACFNR